MAEVVDVAIVGGGVAGLWTRARLEGAGYTTRLYSLQGLGAGQTIASQGILHRGVKYAFSQAAAKASTELDQAFVHWERALAGQGEIDLSSVAMLSPATYLWSVEGALSRMTAMIGARAMSAKVDRLEEHERPSAFAGAGEGITVRRADEPVVDVASLCRALAANARGEIVELQAGESQRWRGESRAVVMTAGAGNETELRVLGVDWQSLCQRRPLHMVMVRGPRVPLFGHCVRELSDKPRLTITTGTLNTSSRENGDPELVWYIGGEVAERGVSMDPGAVIEATREEVAACLPWVDTSGWRWSTLRIDRAEGKTPEGRRPDGAVVIRIGPAELNAIAVWPTKLALAPAAAERVLALLREAGVEPTGTPGTRRQPADPVRVAPAPWEVATWS